MLNDIWRSVVISAAVSLVIYTILLLGIRVAPQFYPRGLDPWIMLVLFGVQFGPRLIMILVDEVLKQRKKQRRRRKT